MGPKFEPSQAMLLMRLKNKGFWSFQALKTGAKNIGKSRGRGEAMTDSRVVIAIRGYDYKSMTTILVRI